MIDSILTSRSDFGKITIENEFSGTTYSLHRRDTAHYSSFISEVNTGAMLRKQLVLLKTSSAARVPHVMLS
jgi:hypothetical protein